MGYYKCISVCVVKKVESFVFDRKKLKGGFV